MFKNLPVVAVIALILFIGAAIVSAAMNEPAGVLGNLAGVVLLLPTLLNRSK